MSEWISVVDRLPKKDVPVLLYQPNEMLKTLLGKMTRCGWRSFGGRGAIRKAAITHWHSLPEPPKE